MVYLKVRLNFCSVYIADNLSYTRIEGNKIGNCEEGWVELNLKSDEKFLLGAIYRPPNNSINDFTEGIEQFAMYINESRTRCIIAGDLNIDLNVNAEYLNSLNSSGLRSLNTLPTRSTAQSESNIDHIYLNTWLTEYIMESGTIKTPDFTDHDAIYCFLKNTSTVFIADNDPTSNEKYYNFSQFDKNKFISKIQNLDFRPVLNNDDPDAAYNIFVTIFMSACEEYLKPPKSKSNKLRRSWMTPGIVTSIGKRDKLYKTLKRQPFNTHLKK